jgi:arylsulfatase A-like enzyme
VVWKWDLWGNLRPQLGFREWVTTPHGHTTTFYDAEVIEDGKSRREPQYLTDFWTERAIAFIKASRERPFFLFLSYNGPYGLGASLNHPSRNRHAEYYDDLDLPSFPREAMHPWLHANKQFLNNIGAIRRYACEVSAVDDGVGAVLDALRGTGQEENTVVIFTADQGLAGGQHGLWGMGDHTRPLNAFDGTMHVPLIVRHPGRIPANRTSDALVSNYDLLPSLLSYIDLAERRPSSPELPGRDYSPILEGRPVEWDNTMFFEFENTRAIRTGEWKYVHRFPDGPHELYDLTADPGEQFNLFGQPRQAAIQDDLAGRLEKFFERYADPKYDLWRGGESKTPLSTAESFASLRKRAAEEEQKR